MEFDLDESRELDRFFCGLWCLNQGRFSSAWLCFFLAGMCDEFAGKRALGLDNSDPRDQPLLF